MGTRMSIPNPPFSPKTLRFPPFWPRAGLVSFGSLNVDTGELAYKPVLKTTVRPPVQLMRFLAGGEPIVCTGGHPFWICVDGWVMARHFAPGGRPHCVTGTAQISFLF